VAASVRGMLTLEGLVDLVERDEVDTVLTVFPDMYGRLMGKRITGHFFVSEVARHGMHCCDYLLACDMEMDPVAGYRFSSWDKGYGDFRAVPDLTTLRQAAWLEKTALVICDVYDEAGEALVEVAPRTVLRRQLERAAAAGFLAQAGTELEFFLLRDDYETAAAKGFEGLETFGWYVEDYHTLRGGVEEPVIGAIRRAMDASGVPVEFSKGEWGPGQHEINLRFTEMLEMADRHCIYKQAAKEIAHGHGLGLTFMAKLDERLAGNSCHLHSSLWSIDGRKALFASKQRADSVAALQEPFSGYLAGLLAHARETSLFFAPNVNSYKRYMAATFAPTKIAWSYDNRTVGYRIVGHGAGQRVECRVPGGDTNPYLAMAAVLAAGLDGIAKGSQPPEVFCGDAYAAGQLPSIPATLEEALAEFRSSKFVSDAFGSQVAEHYVRFAEVELEKLRSAVTNWERRRYLERA